MQKHSTCKWAKAGSIPIIKFGKTPTSVPRFYNHFLYQFHNSFSSMQTAVCILVWLFPVKIRWICLLWPLFNMAGKLYHLFHFSGTGSLLQSKTPPWVFIMCVCMCVCVGAFEFGFICASVHSSSSHTSNFTSLNSKMFRWVINLWSLVRIIINLAHFCIISVDMLDNEKFLLKLCPGHSLSTVEVTIVTVCLSSRCESWDLN